MCKFISGVLILFFSLLEFESQAQQVMEEFKKSLIEKEKKDASFNSSKKLGFIAELHSYSYLISDSIVLGGYYVAATYKILPKSTIGLGYEYSVYNHSFLIDLRQELGNMRLRPIFIGNFGYAFKGNTYTYTSNLGIPLEVKPKPNLVYNIGLGTRMYFSKKLPLAFNFGLFYKNEPGFDLSEGKSGIIVIDKYRNIGYTCLFLGISF
jgi:hypothetical protein